MNVAGTTRNAYVQNAPKRVDMNRKASFEDELASQQKAVSEVAAKSDKITIHEPTIGDIKELSNDYSDLMRTRDALYQLGMPKKSSISMQLEYMEAQKAFLQKLVDRGLILPEDIENSFIVCHGDGKFTPDLDLKHSSDLLTDLEYVREYELELFDRQANKEIDLQSMLDHIASLDRLISALTPIARPQ